MEMEPIFVIIGAVIAILILILFLYEVVIVGELTDSINVLIVSLVGIGAGIQICHCILLMKKRKK